MPANSVIVTENGALIEPDDGFFMAASRNDLTALEKYLYTRNLNIDATTGVGKCGMTALALAAKSGCLNAVKRLVSAGCDVNKSSRVFGWTPLMYAVAGCYVSTVEFLLQSGAHVDSGDQSGRTPLILAAEGGHVAMVMTLLQHGAALTGRTSYEQVPVSAIKAMNVNGLTSEDLEKYKDPFQGNDAFLAACWKNNTKIVQELIKRGANVHSKNMTNSSALHIAARGGFLELAQILLSENINPDLQNKFGETSLHVACKSLFKSTVIQANASIVDIENIAKVAELLVKCGCDVTVSDNRHQEPLQTLLKGSFLISGPTSRLGRLRFRLVQLLLSSTASVKVTNLPRPSELSHELTEEHADLLGWLHSFLKTPRSLRHLARTAVRRTIGAQRFNQIRSLGLSPDIERYIML